MEPMCRYAAMAIEDLQRFGVEDTGVYRLVGRGKLETATTAR